MHKYYWATKDPALTVIGSSPLFNLCDFLFPRRVTIVLFSRKHYIFFF